MSERRYSPFEDEELIRGNFPLVGQNVRVLTAGLLGLRPDSVLVAVDCAASAAAYEAARLCPEGKVYVTEKHEEGCDLIRVNARKLGLEPITLLEGAAPQVLWPVSRCDAVLMDAQDETAIETIRWAAEHLNDDGTLLVMVQAVENIGPLMEEVWENFERTDLTQASFCVERDGRLRADGPIFLIRARRARRKAA